LKEDFKKFLKKLTKFSQKNFKKNSDFSNPMPCVCEHWVAGLINSKKNLKKIKKILKKVLTFGIIYGIIAMFVNNEVLQRASKRSRVTGKANT